MIALAVVVLVGAAFAFAFSIGAHYTGACMGMPFAAGAIRAGPALLLMAPLVLVGALLASEGVEQTVGHGLVGSSSVTVGLGLAIVTSALVLTTAYNFLTIPTSTIQILVFSTVGAALGVGAAVQWGTVERLLVLWAIAPVVALSLGFAFVRGADRIRPQAGPPGPLARNAAIGLVAVGGAASFAMGANDVSNASGALVMSGVFGLEVAALVGGLGLALGVLTWGRPLLRRVAFGVVALDPRMAIGAQLAQSAVILVAVTLGTFTSMNQALVGAMIGAGWARGRATVPWKAIRDILAGWAVGPVSGAALGFALTALLRHAGLL